jgi:hypothetical protein
MPDIPYSASDAPDGVSLPLTLKNALRALKVAKKSALEARRDMLAYLIEIAIQQADYEIMHEEKTQARP